MAKNRSKGPSRSMRRERHKLKDYVAEWNEIIKNAHYEGYKMTVAPVGDLHPSSRSARKFSARTRPASEERTFQQITPPCLIGGRMESQTVMPSKPPARRLATWHNQEYITVSPEPNHQQ